MFERPEFHVDTESEEYKLLNPLVAKVDKVGRLYLCLHYLRVSF